MVHKPYNGWYNRDTWVVALWMDNDFKNYQFILKQGRKLISLKKDLLLRALRTNLKIGDPVNWKNVHIGEIRETIKDTLDEQ